MEASNRIRPGVGAHAGTNRVRRQDTGRRHGTRTVDPVEDHAEDGLPRERTAREPRPFSRVEFSSVSVLYSCPSSHAVMIRFKMFINLSVPNYLSLLVSVPQV
jgi:hypothetical protein